MPPRPRSWWRVLGLAVDVLCTSYFAVGDGRDENPPYGVPLPADMAQCR